MSYKRQERGYCIAKMTIFLTEGIFNVVLFKVMDVNSSMTSYSLITPIKINENHNFLRFLSLSISLLHISACCTQLINNVITNID